MSNLGPYSGAGGKNGPWSRSAAPNSGIQQQLMNQGGMSSISSNIVPFQQPQVYSSMGMQQQNLGLGLQQLPNAAVGIAGSQLNSQLFQQVGTIAYPNPRALNANAFQNTKCAPSVGMQAGSNQVSVNPTQKVFTGTVTSVHDNFGFVDEDIFFQTSACVKGSHPIVGDRVLVEALFNPRMPFKWNANRIQVLPMNAGHQNAANRPTKNYTSVPNNYNAVPPPKEGSNGNFNRGRPKANAGGRGRERSRDRDRDEDDTERKKRREDRLKEREKEEKKSPLRRRSRSPKSRRRSRIVPRYMVQIPKIALDSLTADVLEIRRRYANLYIPSDFFNSHFRWLDAFPADKPFSLNKSCSFHIMNKDVDPIADAEAVLEPPDADYVFSAKVMLMSVPGMDDIYQKCCAMAEDKDRRDRDSEERDYVHPTRLINFLVGLRGKNETMAIGGPWSPSLDGECPEKDPSVLIRTAIRTCRALTGIDLSNCTKWYRFVELYYRRGDSTHKGRQVGGARVETVVLFLPDVWSCLPTRLEWDTMQQSYRKQLERKLRADAEPDETQQGDEKEEELGAERIESTHYAQLDPKTMPVVELRRELKARTINTSGLKSQLIAKLNKALKNEAAKSEDDSKEDADHADGEPEEKKMEVEEAKIDEKERQLLEKKFSLPEQQHVLVHPSKSAKSGKFDCTVMSLSLLLDYRPEDTKEHSFEVSLFAELFNEMLMRDFGFCIYRALFDLPEKAAKDGKKRDKDDKTKGKEDEKKDKDKREKKDSSVKSDHESDDEEFDDDDDVSGKEKRAAKDGKKKRERPKMFTKDRHLLLAFIYFDQTHCGYIFEKDIEDLLYTLGMSLSRAQVRKLVGKVITRDSLHYRKLTDKSKEEELIVLDDGEKDASVEELAIGNKKLLPVFAVSSAKENGSGGAVEKAGDGFVMFRGALVDVAKLLAQLERSEKARLDTESRMMDMKADNSKLGEKYHKANSSVKALTADVKEYRDKLKSAEESLHKMTSSSKMFYNTILDIRGKIEPVLLKESKSRWEKETAANVNSEHAKVTKSAKKEALNETGADDDSKLSQKVGVEQMKEECAIPEPPPAPRFHSEFCGERFEVDSILNELQTDVDNIDD